MKTADSMKILGEEIVKFRAAMDGEPDYDAEKDELKRAQECFDQDEAELNDEELDDAGNCAIVRQLLDDVEDTSNTRHGILTEREVSVLQTWLEDKVS
jgi:hypothetical protein